MRKLLISAFVLFLCLIITSAVGEKRTFTYEDYEYTLLNDGTVEITKYTGEAENLIIPKVLDGFTVSSIGRNSFYWCDRLKTINMPNSIVSIGDGAFNKCTSLMSIEIPNSLTSIGKGAFEECNSLTSLCLPDGIVSIGENPFRFCDNLENITVSIEHPALAIIGGALFSKSDKRLVWYPMNRNIDSYVVPSGIQIIGDYAFENNDTLKKISLPSSVKSIGKGSFSGCSSLSSIVVPRGSYAAEYCRDNNIDFTFEELLLLHTSGDYEYRVLEDGTAEIVNCLDAISANISIPKNLDGITVSRIGEMAFASCSGLKSVNIPNSVTSIGASAFSSLLGLTKVTMPNSLTSIEDNAFSACGLTSITIPNSVTDIGANPFSFCQNLEKIKVSTNHHALKTIDGVLFTKDGKRLICYPEGKKKESYRIPEGTQIIGDYAFTESWLSNITIPKSIKSIGKWAFFECNIRSLDIPNGLLSIDDYAFSECGFLANIVIPQSITHIGYAAFSNCYDLISISIPEGVSNIENWAFSGCESAKNLTIPDGIVSIGDYSFYGCNSLKTVRIPNSVISIGEAAFHCESMESASIPENVERIGKEAFSSSSPDFTITVFHNSYAELYCKKNYLNYIYPDSLDWLTN